MTFPEAWWRIIGAAEWFAELKPVLDRFAPAFDEKSLAQDEILMREGDEGNSLYIVLEGKLEVFLEREEKIVVRELGPGAVVGELALMVGGNRMASVRTLEPTRVLEVTRPRVDAVLLENPELMTPFSHILQTRIRRVKIANQLRNVFGQLDLDSLQEIERELTWVELQGGRELFHQGDTADGAYIVINGRLRVVLEDNQRIVGEIGPGEWVGEMALLTDTERSATVFAVRDTELLWWPQAAFDRLTRRFPQIMREVSKLLVIRLQQQMGTIARKGPGTKTLAIIPVRPDVPVGEFSRQLVKALSGYGSILHLTANSVDAALGRKGIATASKDDPGHLRLTPWLVEQESNHAFVVYEADQTWSEWTERTIRHADQILVVADGTSSPSLSENDRRLAERVDRTHGPKKSLVLLQPSNVKTFPGTAKWLDSRGIDTHYHVRKGSTWDVGRVARLLTGNAVCLVLGGGGSRGYAHIGVIRAFEQLRIPIDAIAGTSVGSVIGAAAAVELSSEEILRKCAPIMARFLDPTLPIVSLTSGNRAVQGVLDVAGPADIEDLPIPFFCVSTNLTRAEEVVHRRGSLVIAARASGAVPGIFPPVPVGGDLLVDGGLCNNVPVDVMSSLYGGVIIAVDVIPEVDLAAAGEQMTAISGWDVAWRAVNPFSKPVAMPNIVNILMRSATAASVAFSKTGEKSKFAALYLRPAVTKWNILDFKSAGPIAEEGYRGSIKELETFWAANRERIMGRQARH